MNDKGLGVIFSTLIMGACCIGLPLLLGVLGGAGLFAWIAGNPVVWVIAAVSASIAVLIVHHRHRPARGEEHSRTALRDDV